MWGVYVNVISNLFVKSQLIALLKGSKKKSVVKVYVDDDVSNGLLIVENGANRSFCFSLVLNSIDFDLLDGYYADGEVIVHHGTIVNDGFCDLLLHSSKKWRKCIKWELY